MIQHLRYFKSLLFSKKAKGGYWTEVGMYAVVVLAILAAITIIAGITPTDLATLIVTGIRTVINKVTSKF